MRNQSKLGKFLDSPIMQIVFTIPLTFAFAGAFLYLIFYFGTAFVYWDFLDFSGIGFRGCILWGYIIGFIVALSVWLQEKFR